jgi:D-glycero-alpha-D-manno-heptose-7-phosphate kinase
MIISRTPFRISFFGGGTDYPVWFRENGGAVLATTIDKYCYITCRYLPPFFEHRSTVIWSQIERVNDVSEIQHPSVKATLGYMGVGDGVAIHHEGDLPARTGLGSSSSFTVGLLNSLCALRGIMPSKRQLATDAITIEQEVLEESVGSQDQISAAFGGLNRISFGVSGDFQVQPVIVPSDRLDQLQDSLMLFYSGLSRNASEVAAEQIKATPSNTAELTAMHQLVDEATEVLCGDGDLSEFGRLLHENWRLKRGLTSRITTDSIDAIYDTAMSSGAVGGKLLGAGGGGFVLLYVRPEDQRRVKDALDGLLHVPFRFESLGSQIIFYEPDASVDRSAASASSASGERSQTKVTGG